MNPADAEILRHAARDFLAPRHPTAHPFAAIRRRVETMVDFRFSDEELISALAVLCELGMAARTTDPLGSTLYYQSTATGLLDFDRRVRI